MSASVAAALNRLRSWADQAWNGFPTTHWTKVAGPGPDALELHGSGGLAGLRLEPSQDLHLRCAFNPPATACGVALTGQPLLGTLFTLYPCRITAAGQPVFEEGGVPVAAGPALFPILPALEPGRETPLELVLQIPPNQTTTWFNLRLSTPALRARFETWDIAYAQLQIADGVATTAAERAAVEQAAALVPLEPPTDEATVAALTAQLTETLSPLREAAEALRVHLVGHSHIDLNWLWTWPDTVETIKRDFRSVIALMDEFPELTFSHSQPATYEIIRQSEPALFARVLEHIRHGRWEPLTLQWAEGDLNLAAGEAQARQLLEAVRWSREVLGVSPTIFHAPDSFGHPGNLPQLVVQAGGRGYYHHRCNPGGADLWPAYWWGGQDSTRLLTVSTHTYNGEIWARDLALAALRAKRCGQPCGLHFHGIGDHGGGPSRQNLEALRRFQATPLLPEAFCSRLDTFLDELRDSGASLPAHEGELGFIFEGCYTTHADTKRYNRTGENLLLSADALAALAGLDRRAELSGAWRSVLLNQFHDILDGSGIHEVYEQNRLDHEAVAATAGQVTDAALTVLEGGLPAGAVAVTNPLGVERREWVSVAGLTGAGAVRLIGTHGHETVGQYGSQGLGFVACVPAYGTVGYTVAGPAGLDPLACEPAYAPTDGRSIHPPADAAERAPYLRLETPHFTVYLRRDCGVLVSFVDRRVNRELVGFGLRRSSDYLDSARPDLALNVFQLLDEHPHGMSSWQVHEVHTEHSLLRGATTRVVEQGPARLVIEVEHHVRASTIRQRISFYRDLPRVDFETFVDWRELGTGEAGVPDLKAAFTAHLDDCQAWFETPFAAVRRPADGQEVPALRWAAIGGDRYGLALLNDSKHGYDALGCRLRLTLLRSGYDPDAISDVGEHTIRYALLPYPGDWRDAGVVAAAASFNQPLLARVAAGGPPVEAVRPTVSGLATVQIASLKAAHDGAGLVVRLYESGGRSGQATLAGLPAGARVTELNVVEDRLAALTNHGGAVSLTFRPWQVRTVRIEG